MRVYNEEVKKFLNGAVEFTVMPGMFYLEDVKAKNVFIVAAYNYSNDTINLWHYENNKWINEWINAKQLSSSKISETKYYINELNVICASMYLEAKDILSELLRNGINSYMKYVDSFYTDTINNFNMHWILIINSIILEVIQNSSTSQCKELKFGLDLEEKQEEDNEEEEDDEEDEVEIEEYDIDEETENNDYFEGIEDDNNNDCIGDCKICKYQYNCIDTW